MQVGGTDPAGGTGKAEDLPGLHGLSDRNLDLAQMGIGREQPQAMVEEHQVATVK